MSNEQSKSVYEFFVWGVKSIECHCTYATSGPLSVLLRAVLPHLRVRHGHPGRAPPRRQAGLAQPPLRPRGVSKDDGGRQVGRCRSETAFAWLELHAMVNFGSYSTGLL